MTADPKADGLTVSNEGGAMREMKERGKAFRKLSFYSKKHHSHWYIKPPSERLVEAKRQLGDGDRLDRDTALYGIGCEQGAAAADEYMELLCKHGFANSCGGELQHIALAMLRNGDDDSLVRGQAVGFFFGLQKWLDFAARHGRIRSS